MPVEDINTQAWNVYGQRQLARAHMAPGLVRDFQADTMTIVAPDDDSWAVADPDGTTVRAHGPRDVWAELEDVHAHWVRAGRPSAFRVDVPEDGGTQNVTCGAGPSALDWALPTLSPAPWQSA
ncbi:hypothetical protein AQI95_28830 [Streptomyces yokosukanensis]|uniref:Uncharacterized protein n=1 Tax=Streptomyces yokosukanensis TaxID=67386 RepID=A0A101NZD2_9ACTN|nr:hypothetical protein [Streptomyces yokosukanensis]KUN02086.1 hypothetical protein AQI95_28830 [Streptomyces yokosukanensis]